MLLVDSREHKSERDRVTATFDAEGVEYSITKLFIGDYMEFTNPSVIVDRKQTIAELVKNCTDNRKKGQQHRSEVDRFKAELERAKSVGATLVILVEQNRYKDRERWIHVDTIEDLMLWSSPHTTIRGEKVYRVLRAWMAKYPIRVEFCDKRQTGRRILEIIYGD